MDESVLRPTTEKSLSDRRRVKLPLGQCTHEARLGQEMTPERVAEVLIEEEARAQRMALTP